MEEEEETVISLKDHSDNGVDKEEKKNGFIEKLLIVFTIGLIIGYAVGFVLHSVVPTPETPIYKEYTSSSMSDNEGIYNIRYTNNELDVKINKNVPAPHRYNAVWYHENEDIETPFFDSDEELLLYIDDNWVSLSEDQLKWFDYMIRNVVE